MLGVGHLWGLAFPINKFLWTSSYVLVAAGWSTLALTLFYWLIDMRGYQRWAFPFIVVGMNAITIYVARSFLMFDHISANIVRGLVHHFPEFRMLFIVAGSLALKWLFVYFLYKKKIFLKA